jgi:hypothetical protein
LEELATSAVFALDIVTTRGKNGVRKAHMSSFVRAYDV